MGLRATAAACVTREEYDALRATLLAVRARAAALEQQPRRPTDADLIAAIADATVGRVFNAQELFAHRLVDEHLQTLLEHVTKPPKLILAGEVA